MNIDTITRNNGLEPHDAEAIIEALSQEIKSAAMALQPVAIPSFGTFVATKIDERISVDHSTGKRMLFPPSIEMQFVAAEALKKRIKNHE